MLKSILILLENTADSESRMDAAVTIAQEYKAHMVGLQVLPTLEKMMKTVSYLSYPVEIYREQHHEISTQAMALWDAFEDRMKKADIAFDRHQEEGDSLSFLKSYSRSCDMTIISQAEAGTSKILDDTASFILGSGLPVIAVPEKMTCPTLGKNILIAWNDSAQSARAVHDALPLLEKADKVSILTVGEYDKEAATTADICIQLARHGIEVTALQGDITNKPEESILLKAEDLGADLIVAGAWGHSRLREIIMGGVTKSLYSNQVFPVFFSH